MITTFIPVHILYHMIKKIKFKIILETPGHYSPLFSNYLPFSLPIFLFIFF